MAMPKTLGQANKYIGELQLTNHLVNSQVDDLKRENDMLARTAASLKEQLEAATTAQQPQPAGPKLTPKQQAAVGKSNSILNSLRGSASASQTSTQQPLQQNLGDLKYTQTQVDNLLADARKEWLATARVEAEQFIQKLNSEHNATVQSIISQATHELNYWKGLLQNNANSTVVGHFDALKEQHKKQLADAQRETWHARVEGAQYFNEKNEIVGELKAKLKAQEKLAEDYRMKWNDVQREKTQETGRADKNFKACMAERESKMQVILREERVIDDFREEIKRLKEQIKEKEKKEKAKRPKVAPAPQPATAPMDHSRWYRPQPVAKPVAPTKPAATPAKSRAAPAAEPTPAPNTNKKRKRGSREAPAWDNPPASKLLKTAAITSFIGLVHVAKERGYF